MMSRDLIDSLRWNASRETEVQRTDHICSPNARRGTEVQRTDILDKAGVVIYIVADILAFYKYFGALHLRMQFNRLKNRIACVTTVNNTIKIR
jgi:hypothetical protein